MCEPTCPKLWARDPAADPRREDAGRDKRRGKNKSQRNSVLTACPAFILVSKAWPNSLPSASMRQTIQGPHNKPVCFEFLSLVTERILTKQAPSNTQLFIDLPTSFNLFLGKVTADGKWFFFFFLLFWTVQNFCSEHFYHLIFSVHLLVQHYVP